MPQDKASRFIPICTLNVANFFNMCGKILAVATLGYLVAGEASKRALKNNKHSVMESRAAQVVTECVLTQGIFA